FVTIIEGESLVNDGTALVIYRVAIAAVVTGSFSFWDAGLRFVANAVGGVAIGVAVGFLVAAARRRLHNPPVETTISLLTGYFAYLPAQAAGASGALAVVTAGIYPAAYLPRWAFPSIRARDPYPPLSWPTAIGWSGMRGAVSLAAALALPLTVKSGAVFPHRDLIVFLTFCVILGTLVVQGLTLPVLIRVLGFEDDGLDAREEAKARIKSAEAALVRLEEIVAEGGVLEDTAERVRGALNFRSRRFRARFDDGDDGSIEERSQAYQRLM